MFVQLTQEFLGRKAGERIDVEKSHADTLIEKGVTLAQLDGDRES